MCADYQMPGVSDTEVYMETFGKLYKEIKAEGVMEYIDITTKIDNQWENHWEEIFKEENNE